MKKTLLITFAGIGLMLSSCTIITPHDISEAKIGSKVGVSKTIILFNALYLNNNFGLTEAVKNGKITGGVATIDNKTTNMIFFQTKEIIVTGE